LIDKINDDEIIGRSVADAPEIDGVVYVISVKDLKVADREKIE